MCSFTWKWYLESHLLRGASTDSFLNLAFHIHLNTAFKHINEHCVCIFHQHPTALAKILGVYRIGYQSMQTNDGLKQDLLVMENLFYDKDITQVPQSPHFLCSLPCSGCAQ